MMSVLHKKFSIVLGVLMITASLDAQVYLGPKSIGYANAFVTQSRGAEVIGWNPANLGYNDNPTYSLKFGVIPFIPFPNTQLTNSAISFSWFNRYIGRGGHLTNTDKHNMLAAFPSSGWDITPMLNTKFIGYSYGNTAITLEGNLQGNLLVPTSLLGLIFYGNRIDQSVQINDFRTEAQAVGALTLAQARNINIPYLSRYINELYIGGGVKTLLGIGYAGTDPISARFDTRDADHISLDSKIKAQYALGGFGIAFDAGISAVVNNRIKAGISVQNLFGFIQWNGKHTEGYKYDMHFESDTLDRKEVNFDNLYDNAVKVDTTFDPGRFRTPYPGYLLMGMEYSLTNEITLYGAYQQGFSNRFSSSIVPRFSLAGDYHPFRWIRLRSGIALGGKERFQMTAGLGLHSRHYSFDLGIATVHGFFNHSRGITFALGQEIYW